MKLSGVLRLRPARAVKGWHLVTRFGSFIADVRLAWRPRWTQYHLRALRVTKTRGGTGITVWFDWAPLHMRASFYRTRHLSGRREP